MQTQDKLTPPKKPIYVDTNEASNYPQIVKYLELFGFPVIIKKLDVGDYFYPPVLIEHKTLNNYIMDVWNKHIFQQAQDMVYNVPNIIPYIFLSFDYSELSKDSTSQHAMLGAYAFLNYLGTKTQCVGNLQLFRFSLVQLFEKYSKYETEPIYINPIRKPATIDDELIYFYSAFAGVGEEIARNIAKVYPVPYDFLTSSVQDLQKVDLIKRKRAKRIYNFIHQIKEAPEDGNTKNPL